jgi:tetratricopeptide (TPR) repeat protein
MIIKKLVIIFSIGLSFSVIAKQNIEWCDNKAEKILNSAQALQFESRIKEWNKYEQQCSHNGRYQKWLADIYISHGRFNQATAYLKSFVNESSFDNREHMLFYVGLLIQLGDFQESRALIDKLIKEHCNWHGGYFLRGMHYYEQKQYNESEEYFQLALDKKPDDHDSMAWLSHIYYIQKKYDKVLFYFNNAMKHDYFATLLKINPSLSAAAVLLRYNHHEDLNKLLSELEKVHKDIEKYSAYRQIKKILHSAQLSHEEKHG